MPVTEDTDRLRNTLRDLETNMTEEQAQRAREQRNRNHRTHMRLITIFAPILLVAFAWFLAYGPGRFRSTPCKGHTHEGACR